MSWFNYQLAKRSSLRLEKEITSLKLRVETLASSTPGCLWHGVCLWHQEALDLLNKAEGFRQLWDVEGGWHCFLAAQRLLFKGMSGAELVDEAVVLRLEADKLHGWRKDAIKSILCEKGEPTVEQLLLASRIRDESFTNRYHKIWLTSDQLLVLFVVTFVVTILFLLMVQFVPASNPQFDLRTLTVIALFGILGSAFSVGQSVIGMAVTSGIPEFVANFWITVMRTLFGAVTGLAGYFFFQTGVFKFLHGCDPQKTQLAVLLSVAFAFGFTGEKLITRALGSFES